MDKRTQFSIWYFILGLLVLVALQEWLGTSHQIDLNYSDFKKAVAAGQVSDLVIGKDSIRGSITYEAMKQFSPAAQAKQLTESANARHTFSTVRVEDPDLARDLQAAQLTFRGAVESNGLSNLLSWILPMAVMVVIWQFLLRRMGAGHGMMSIGKSKARVYVENDIKLNFSHVAGVDEAVEELREVVSFLKTPDQFTRLGGRLPKGILLAGPPGTGKTLLARAVAGEARVPFFSLSGSEFVEMFVGVGAARVRDLFEQAQAKAPCIVFIDELDALGRARGANPAGSNEEREQTLNQLLTEMDGFNPNNGVILMAATNRPEILDPALLRAGRFDRHVVVDRPDVVGREAILRVHAAHLVLGADVDLKILAARTPGFVGADLANIVNEAALLAARAGKAAVDMNDFEEAIDRTVAGLRKKSQLMSPAEKHRVAVHEAGHALVATLVEHADPIRKVSIIPRGVAALGFTIQLPAQDRHLYTRTEIVDRLAVLLGGRVAERLLFEEASTGAADDLQKATALARSCLVEYGMSEQLGPVAFNMERASFLNAPGTQGGADYSAETAVTVDREIRALLEGVETRVHDLLDAHRNLLVAIAARLETIEIMDGAELRQIVERERANPAARPTPAKAHR
ncbi:ATP-dependent metallopeptidase FtsH/Yme1/Tma family protein [Herbaspirillum sp. HC18]|nr:ATP-dependent metallopeptidase FtsH/Yme1/Tma family protein [Herbaspirillum sp. HC18]